MNSDTQTSSPLAKDIALTGYSTSPSDRQCQDGDLSCSYNMINEEGAMSPIMSPPMRLTGVMLGVKRGFIHSVNGGRKKNLVVIVNQGGLWMARFYIGIQEHLEGTAQNHTVTDNLSETIIQLQGDVAIAAVGNTLVLTSHQEKRYILWKVGDGDQGGYYDLGDEIPNPSLSVSLYSATYGNDTFVSCQPENAADRNVTLNYTCAYGSSDYSKKDNQMAIHNAVMAMCNKFVAETHQKGRFMFPFLVRYAWRLFDGTLTKHSAPILMMPSTRVAPIVAAPNHVEGDRRTEECTPMAITSQLMCLLSDPLPATIDKWADIVSSLEIFVSEPIYSYRQDINSFDDDNFQQYVLRGIDKPDSFSLSLKDSLTQAWHFSNLNPRFPYVFWHFYPPRYSPNEIRKKIEECSTFFHLCTIDRSELSSLFYSSRVLSKEDVGDLRNLVSREAMTDDYDSRDSVRGQRAFAYNNRVSLANIKKTLYGGGLPRDLSSAVYNVTDNYTFQVYFFIKTSSGISVVTSGESDGRSAMVPYLYYPNTGCYKAVIKRSSGTSSQYMEVQMKPHKFLNGSLWVADADRLMPSVEDPTQADGFVPDWFTPTAGYANALEQSNADVYLPNKIYTSEVDNPFATLVTNISTVGQGEIMGVSTAAKALSQGQFGQFPLYAFASDGVWALTVSATGGFSSVQPITQDVCTNPESITQLDSSVVFATRRGLMQLSGSTAECITTGISTEDPFNLNTLPGMDRLHVLLGHNEGDTCLPTKSFNEYLKDAVVLFDYVHQRLYLGNPRCNYTYVFSLQSRQWGWYGGPLAIPLNSYPHAMAFLHMDGTTSVYDFSSDGEDDGRTLRSGLIVTRPIKLDAVDILKTAVGVYLRGLFRPTNANVILWGSRDLRNWNLIGSSTKYYLEGMRGDGYKYFRVGIKSSLQRGDRISGMTFSFMPRMNNRIR